MIWKQEEASVSCKQWLLLKRLTSSDGIFITCSFHFENFSLFYRSWIRSMNLEYSGNIPSGAPLPASTSCDCAGHWKVVCLFCVDHMDEEAEGKENLSVLLSLQTRNAPVLLKLHLLNSCCCVPNLSIVNSLEVYLFMICVQQKWQSKRSYDLFYLSFDVFKREAQILKQLLS